MPPGLGAGCWTWRGRIAAWWCVPFGSAALLPPGKKLGPKPQPHAAGHLDGLWHVGVSPPPLSAGFLIDVERLCRLPGADDVVEPDGLVWPRHRGRPYQSVPRVGQRCYTPVPDAGQFCYPPLVPDMGQNRRRDGFTQNRRLRRRLMAPRQGSVRQRHRGHCPARTDSLARCTRRCAWSYRYRDPSGRQHEKSGFASRKVAEAALREVLGDVDRGTWRQLEPIGFEDFTTRWLDTIKPLVRPATYASYAGAARNHLVPFFGNVALTSMSREQVDRFVAAKLTAVDEKGRRVWSPKTVSNVLMVLKRLIGSALDWGYIATDFVAKVKPPKAEHVERELLTPHELGKLFTVAGEPWALMFRVYAFTALRRGELLGLRWRDVELDSARIHVRQSYGRYGFGEPKSKAGRRVVALAPSLVTELRRHKLAAPPNAHDLVFVSRSSAPVDPDNLYRAWARALRKAGLRHVPMHSLRHTAVSLLIEAGANPKQLQKMVGHSSISMTLDVYGHLMPDSLDGLAMALDAIDIVPEQNAEEAAIG